MTPDAPSAYDTRAAEYADLLGTMASVHPSDRALFDAWSEGLTGEVLDAGCGPGHWTAHLHDRGIEAWGMDASTTFIEHARATHPSLHFEVGDLHRLPVSDGALAGILAWYSVIHLPPAELPAVITELHRAVRPGGGLLLGFFIGPRIAPFDHAVTTAYAWPLEEMTRLLGAAGFTVVETHSRTSPDHRPHGAVTARRRESVR